MDYSMTAKAYRHVDCGGILIPHIFSEIKTSAPPLYMHGCTRCEFKTSTALADAARYVPAFAAPIGAESIERKP